MEIIFYIPLPNIETLTWLLIYMQAGLIVTIFLSFGECNYQNNDRMMFQVLLSSVIIIPIFMFLYLFDRKEFDRYFRQKWTEHPAQARKRFNEDF